MDTVCKVRGPVPGPEMHSGPEGSLETSGAPSSGAESRDPEDKVPLLTHLLCFDLWHPELQALELERSSLPRIRGGKIPLLPSRSPRESANTSMSQCCGLSPPAKGEPRETWIPLYFPCLHTAGWKVHRPRSGARLFS